MLEALNAFCLRLTDGLLHGLLTLPSDLAILLVALGSALVFTLVRRVTTPQDWLRRAAEDRATLKQLLRAARQRRDRDAIDRHRASLSLISLGQLRAEGWPLLASILPIALIGLWCYSRLEFHPPAANEPIRLALYAPVSHAGQPAHIVPAPGLDAVEGRWIQPAAPVTDDGPPHALATWSLRANANPTPYTLLLRLGHRTLEHPLLIGQPHYAPPLIDHGDGWVTQAMLRERRPLGFIPSLPMLMLPAWLVAYLLLVVPLVLLTKKLLRIY